MLQDRVLERIRNDWRFRNTNGEEEIQLARRVAPLAQHMAVSLRLTVGAALFQLAATPRRYQKRRSL
jgi:hypothetical protein